MAKPRIPNQKKQYRMLDRRLAAYMAAVRRIYAELSSEAAKIVTSSGYDGKKPFSWRDYPNTKARMRKLQERFVSQLSGLIMSGTSDEWKRSNLQQDLIVNRVLKAYHTSRDDGKNEKYYRNNEEALKAFQTRKEQGMNISNKLWDQSQAYREELQDVISVAIERGTDAVTLSKQISKYLRDFPSMQRDYKDKYGRASKAQNCEFRSIRLARSEINMAYRSAEQERWRQLDFVVGYEIKMSGAHPAHDVCDSLAGKYPKDFRWVGWHPNCMCYEIPILKTEDEFYGESKQVQPEIKGKVDSEKVESKLEGKSFMFETSEVFKYELHPEDREAVESFADRLGRFNPKGEVMSFSIDDVVQTQQYVGTKNVIQIAQSIEKDGLQDNPTGIKVGDKVFIVDGHNRIAAMRLGGSNTFDIRVVEVSEEEWKAAGGQVPAGGFESKQRIGSSSINEVHDVPQEFKDWCTENWQRIENSRHNDTLPYFLSDNRQYVKEQLTIERATELRHANRDEKAILHAWENRQALKQNYGVSLPNLRRKAEYWGVDTSALDEYVYSGRLHLDEYGEDERLDALMTNIAAEVSVKAETARSRFDRVRKLRTELNAAKGAYHFDDIIAELDKYLAEHNPRAGEMVYGSRYEATKVGDISEFIRQQQQRIEKRRDVLHSVNESLISSKLGVEKMVPMSFEEADELRGNPMFLSGLDEYTCNCQSCVVANELRRRGYDVEAKPNYAIPHSPQFILSFDTRSIWVDRKTGLPPVAERISLRGIDDVELANAIMDKIKTQGRYNLSVTWEKPNKNGEKYGHVFTIERKRNGTIFAYDPQTGEMDRVDYSLLLEYLLQVDRSRSVVLYRIDNCDVNTQYLDKIVKKK